MDAMIDTNNLTCYVVIEKTLIGPITTDEDNTANLQVNLKLIGIYDSLNEAIHDAETQCRGENYAILTRTIPRINIKKCSTCMYLLNSDNLYDSYKCGRLENKSRNNVLFHLTAGGEVRYKEQLDHMCCNLYVNKYTNESEDDRSAME